MSLSAIFDAAATAVSPDVTYIVAWQSGGCEGHGALSICLHHSVHQVDRIRRSHTLCHLLVVARVFRNGAGLAMRGQSPHRC